MVKAAGRHVARRWFPGVGGREVATSAASIGLASVMLVTTMAVTRTDQAAGHPLPSSPPTVSSLLPPTSAALPPPTVTVGPPSTIGPPGTTAPGAGPPPGTSPIPGGTPTTVGGGRPPGPPPTTTVPPPPPPATTAPPPPPPPPTTAVFRNKAHGVVSSGRPICSRVVDHGTQIQQPCNGGNQR